MKKYENVSQHGYPLFYIFQIVSDLLGKSQEYLVVIWGCAPLKLDLGICKDGPLGTCHWRLLKNWLNWSNQQEPTGRNSPERHVNQLNTRILNTIKTPKKIGT